MTCSTIDCVALDSYLYLGAVVHDGAVVVPHDVVRVDLIELRPVGGVDVVPVDADVIVTVRSHLLVPQSQTVSDLVNGDSELLRTKRQTSVELSINVRHWQGRRSIWDRGDTSPQYLDWGGTLSRMSPSIFLEYNISYFLSMQYFLDKLKELLVFLVFSQLVQGVVGTL